MHVPKFMSALAFLTIIVVFANDAEAKQHRYAGHHPIGSKLKGSYCHIEFPHVHVYAPYKAKLLYRKVPDGYYFVGDPVAHGYEGERFSYHGAHPIHVEEVVLSVNVETPVVEWCYIKGPHYHSHPPSSHASFEVKGDVHWYVGEYPPEFEVAKPTAVRINTVYTPIRYSRPVVVVEPPSAYVDVFVAAPPVPLIVPPGPPGVIVAPPGPPGAVLVAPGPPGGVFVPGGVHFHGKVHGKAHGKGHYSKGKHKGHFKYKKPKHYKHKGRKR